MRNSRVKNFLSFFFLIAFVLLRVVNTHAITQHEEESTAHQCELCELIQVTNEPLQLPDVSTFEIPAPVLIFIQKDDLNSDYAAPVDRYILPDRHFNKPPPTL